MTDGATPGGPAAEPVPPPVPAEGGAGLPAEEPPGACAACGRALKPGASFCGYCGLPAGAPPPVPVRPRESFSSLHRRVSLEWNEVSFVIKFYVAMLAIQIVTAVVIRSGADEFTAYLVADVLLAVVTGVAAAMHWGEVRALLVRPAAGPLLLGVVAVVAVPLFLLIHAFVSGLHAAFHVEETRYLEAFEGRSLWWPVVVLCVNAAVFEEVAFRGVIFGLLRRHIRVTETLLITSMAFAILHLSVFALVSHTLLGLYLGWLRHRSGSLALPILAHFLHNALVLANEHWGVLGGVTPGG